MPHVPTPPTAPKPPASTFAPAVVAVAGSCLLAAAPWLPLPRQTEEGYHLVDEPRRSAGEVAATRAALPAGACVLPPTDRSALPRTFAALSGGGALRVVAVGDSIVNDVMRSGWTRDLEAAHPGCEVTATSLVRGCGGCRHYRERGRVRRYVVPLAPDLVVIGGISHRKPGAVRDVIEQLRADLPDVEILLTGGVFGPADPRDPAALNAAPYAGGGEWGRDLAKLARTDGVAFFDFTTPWAELVRSTGGDPAMFYRDAVHANPLGEQTAAAVLLGYFAGGGRVTVGPRE